jgi:hypothetical protein
MIALDPVASKLPGRTGVRCPGGGTLSQRERLLAGLLIAKAANVLEIGEESNL